VFQLKPNGICICASTLKNLFRHLIKGRLVALMVGLVKLKKLVLEAFWSDGSDFELVPINYGFGEV